MWSLAGRNLGRGGAAVDQIEGHGACGLRSRAVAPGSRPPAPSAPRRLAPVPAGSNGGGRTRYTCRQDGQHAQGAVAHFVELQLAELGLARGRAHADDEEYEYDEKIDEEAAPAWARPPATTVPTVSASCCELTSEPCVARVSRRAEAASAGTLTVGRAAEGSKPRV